MCRAVPSSAAPAKALTEIPLQDRSCTADSDPAKEIPLQAVYTALHPLSAGTLVPTVSDDIASDCDCGAQNEKHFCLKMHLKKKKSNYQI